MTGNRKTAIAVAGIPMILAAVGRRVVGGPVVACACDPDTGVSFVHHVGLVARAVPPHLKNPPGVVGHGKILGGV